MALTVVQAIVAGFIGAIVMAILMAAMSKGQPGINAMVVARATGKSPQEARMGGAVAHFAYSLVMGVVFVLGTNVLSFDALLGLSGHWVNGILFGILLFLVMAVLVFPVAGVTKEMMRQMPASQKAGAFLLHILYGLILVASITWVPVA